MITSSGRNAKPVTARSKCKSCGAEVMWGQWRDSGKWTPIDAEPDMRPLPKGGNVVLSLRGGQFGQLLIETYRADVHGQERNRYTTHWATCPNAEEHRRGR